MFRGRPQADTSSPRMKSLWYTEYVLFRDSGKYPSIRYKEELTLEALECEVRCGGQFTS